MSEVASDETGSNTDVETYNTTSNIPKPDKRQYNPLSEYPSYTYQLSLYMITPDAYDTFVQNNRTGIDSLYDESGKGAYLIAQSGGINNDVTPRAPGFLYDYYIDDLKIETAIAPKESGMSAATVDLSFTITEPYGFSFITNLKKASDSVTQYSQAKNIKDLRNPSRQFFILGVRFLGYDARGNPIKETNGMFERYWDIIITKINFKIDGKATVYSIKAASLAIQAALGTQRGMINEGASVKGNTVMDVLSGNSDTAFGLMTKLNNDERRNKDAAEYNNYAVEFIPALDTSISNASIVDKADIEKAKTPFSPVKTTSNVNVAAENSATPNLNARQITFKNDTPVVQAIQQIISQSSYLVDSLKQVYTTDTSPSKKTDSNEEIVNDTVKKLKWYNISLKTTNPRFDNKRKQFCFDITYVISPYEIPVIVSTYANKTTKYYGPIKKYQYWYTGKNTEIIRYEQTLDNSYFNVALGADGSPNETGGNADIPIAFKRQNASRLNKMNVGAEAQNQIVTQLMDPGSYAMAKIEILGDPDWLIQPAAVNVQDSTATSYYGVDGFSVNPNKGQVFIEINFLEAVDYDNNKGVMKINDKITFWEYPPEIKKQVEGVSYQIIHVTNYFKGGKFTQLLTGTINTFGYDKGLQESDSQREPPNDSYSYSNYLGNLSEMGRAATGSAPTTTGTTSGGTGFKPSPTLPNTTNSDISSAEASPVDLNSPEN